ncbi:hypothetical protein C8F04DRAFT_361432 [Mycena alexandri]|uniref:Uncharacterized protein n=1 Tax=Mycena alexandri TaxID=1745969 RepID=A0AAD6T334_9AGAR|nr:hypothetical protein C8F04DRAFT_361432 [Mycena alexandri]
MHTPSLISSDGSSSRHSSTCCCGQHHDSLYRAPTRASFCSSESTAADSQPKKMRYGGRGGAGSRARDIRVPRSSPPPIVENGQYTFASIQPESQTSDLTAIWVRQSASPGDSCNVPTETAPRPAIPTSSLAGRRGANKILAPLILSAPASQTVPTLNTPLSAMSTTTSSTATDSEFAPTPRSPYFYFDDAFDSRSVAAERPLPSHTSSSSISRSLKRLASRTQGLRDLFLKPPSMPPTPTSPTHPASSSQLSVAPPVPPLPSASRPSSQASQASGVSSEWYDPPESPTLPEPSDLPSSPIVIELPHRARSASVVTVKGPTRALKHKGDRKRKHREQPRAHGEWNRDDLAEVIVSLRML